MPASLDECGRAIITVIKFGKIDCLSLNLALIVLFVMYTNNITSLSARFPEADAATGSCWAPIAATSWLDGRLEASAA